MQTLVADANGAIITEFRTVPGKEYSLYLIPHTGAGAITAPTGGVVNFLHMDTEIECPVIEFDGTIVELDLADKPGIAASFVAHSNSLQLSATGLANGGNGLDAGDGLRFSLLPTIR